MTDAPPVTERAPVTAAMVVEVVDDPTKSVCSSEIVVAGGPTTATNEDVPGTDLTNQHQLDSKHMWLFEQLLLSGKNRFDRNIVDFPRLSEAQRQLRYRPGSTRPHLDLHTYQFAAHPGSRFQPQLLWMC
jgi:hypothetical protein